MKKLIITSLLFSSVLQASVITRAALDVGSGGMKVTVADVDPAERAITQIHYSKEHPVAFRRDMQVNKVNRFSQEIQQIAFNTLQDLQKELEKYHPVEWSGIATAASRQAENAQEMYNNIFEKLGINIRIIPQAEEGRIGFETAAAASGIDRTKLIAYDSGSGSFQLSTESEIVEGDFGYINALAALIEEIRSEPLDQKASPHPVTAEEARQLTSLLRARAPQMSELFRKKLSAAETVVVGIGTETFIFATAAIAIGKSTYTKEELWEAIVENCNKTDAQFHQFVKPEEVMIGLVLLYSVMEELGIKQLTYQYANGSCEGVLVDPAYWDIK